MWRFYDSNGGEIEALAEVSRISPGSEHQFIQVQSGVPVWTDGQWQSYTPVWTAASTQPAIGNGSLNGRYTRIGKTVIGWLNLTFGSTTTPGTGQWFFTPPVTPDANAAFMGNAFLHNPGVAVYPAGLEYAIGSSLIALLGMDGATQRIGVGVPFTWGD